MNERLGKLETAFETHRAITNLRLEQLETRDAERKRAEEELRNKIAELAAKNAALDERARHGEKAADRGWQLWLAALGFGFGLISLLVTASLQIKK